MNRTQPQPPAGGDPVAELRRDLYKDSLWSDQADAILERRVGALEEAAAARWPRSILVRRRLARELRASVAGYGWVGPEWYWRRAQAIGDDWLADR